MKGSFYARMTCYAWAFFTRRREYVYFLSQTLALNMLISYIDTFLSRIFTSYFASTLNNSLNTQFLLDTWLGFGCRDTGLWEIGWVGGTELCSSIGWGPRGGGGGDIFASLCGTLWLQRSDSVWEETTDPMCLNLQVRWLFRDQGDEISDMLR